MILGIGTDIVDIQRFTTWHTKSQTELLRIFSLEEIAYCLHENNARSAERFAVRFAAKEAFLKAFHAMLASQNKTDAPSLLVVQKAVSVMHLAGGAPTLAVNWHTLLPNDTAYPRVHISLSHAQSIAAAFVVLEENH